MMKADDVIQGRYRLEEPIGKGGMAEVWRALDERLSRPAAIKFLAPQFRDDPEFLVRFFAEAQSVAQINHPNVVQVLDFGEVDGRPYLVMEHVGGGSAADLAGQPILPERAAEIVAEAARGAGAAHAVGLVHRDIKPANILLTDEGRAKLADFGIASSAHGERLTATGQAIGSPHYLAPEQASGAGCSPASDVYALGVVLYELITGRPPFDADNVTAIAIAHVDQAPEPPSAFVPDLDPAREELVLRCLAKDPAQRYPDGAALAVALEDPVEALAIFPIDLDHEDEEVRGPHRVVAGVLMTLLILGLLVAGVWAAGRDSGDREQSYDQETVNQGGKPAPVKEGAEESPSGAESADYTSSSTSSGSAPSPSPTAEEKDKDGDANSGGDTSSGGGNDGSGGSTSPEQEAPETDPTPEPTPEPTADPEPTPTAEPTSQEQAPTADEQAPAA